MHLDFLFYWGLTCTIINFTTFLSICVKVLSVCIFHSSIIFFFTYRKSIFAIGNPHSNFGIECINIHGRRNLLWQWKKNWKKWQLLKAVIAEIAFLCSNILLTMYYYRLRHTDKKCKRIICEFNVNNRKCNNCMFVLVVNIVFKYIYIILINIIFFNF